ncbi:hypothetical protein AHIS1636_03190 [Arthrobacter mangrovi]|uniref:Uncharacterized protein n=1 Tax=Arthrobacter mangrovi TaxID=2966350 RepID=A0ABQ5MPG9_9MICC|nr:hypothetical protein AHIS1636_03190 [Arthrobacter mangrovi]
MTRRGLERFAYRLGHGAELLRDRREDLANWGGDRLELIRDGLEQSTRRLGHGAGGFGNGRGDGFDELCYRCRGQGAEFGNRGGDLGRGRSGPGRSVFQFRCGLGRQDTGSSNCVGNGSASCADDVSGGERGAVSPMTGRLCGGLHHPRYRLRAAGIRSGGLRRRRGEKSPA